MNSKLKQLIIGITAATAVAYAGASQATDITGAGATFPYPVYAKWADAYKTQTGIGLNYQSIGSGGGIKQIKAKTVDFRRIRQAADTGRTRQGRLDAIPHRDRRRGSGHQCERH